MTYDQARVAGLDPAADQQKPDAESKALAGGQKKKKSSWLHTILWMLSMMLLVNVAMGIAAYFLFFYNK